MNQRTEAESPRAESRKPILTLSRPGATLPTHWSNKTYEANDLSLSVLALLCLWPAAHAYAASCESVATLNRPNTKVTSAAEVAAGAFAPPGAPARGGGPGAAFASLPAFCRVAATLTPSSDSDIKIEVWLPVSGWNGKFQAVGNGAWQGSIGYAGDG